MSTTPAGLRMTGLNLTLGSGRQILHDIELSAEPGEFVGLVGPNGSGKSSLLRCLYGATKPGPGMVFVDGTDITEMSARARSTCIAAVVQEQPVDFDYTVAELVSIGRAPHHRLMDRFSTHDQRITDDAMAVCDVAEFADRPLHTLSGGEQRRVMLARALAQQPRLMILDEPTNHLDLHYQVRLLNLVRSLGITVVAALHDLSLAAAFCDRIAVLEGGHIIASGPTDDVLTAELISRVYGVAVSVKRQPSGSLAVILDLGAPPQQA